MMRWFYLINSMFRVTTPQFLALFAFVWFINTLNLAAQNSTQPDFGLGRPRVGLVLSGGGAKGMAHVGALKVIEESGIPILPEPAWEAL